MNTPIIDMLMNAGTGTRFHMPGHKGRLELFGTKAGRYDITEIPGADNLCVPKGVIAHSQALFAKETGAAGCQYSVNGSSAGVIAAVLSSVGEGEKIIIGRDAHICVINALKLSGAVPVYVHMQESIGIAPKAVSAYAVCAQIKRNPDAKAVLVTYPNYYGMCTDLSMIVQTAHRYHMRVIVDAAHAAHFPYSPLLPKSPAEAGADIWVVSAHKTLPAMNQCAAVFTSSAIDAQAVKRCLNMVQTTSPSYILLASLDYARAYMAEKGEESFRKLYDTISAFREKIAATGDLRVVETDDFTRIVVDVSGRGITGFHAENFLYNNGITAECADERNVVLIATAFDTKGDFDALLYALRSLPKGVMQFTHDGYELTEGTQYTPREIMRLRKTKLPIEEAEGRVAAESIFAYPPGVPLIIEGQRITKNHITLLTELAARGYNLPAYNETIMVLERRK